MDKPTHFTEEEGGYWLDWISGEVSSEDFAKRDSVNVVVNGKAIHSFGFGIPGKKDFLRWDCVNGLNDSD